jgi:hypothetical protein
MDWPVSDIEVVDDTGDPVLIRIKAPGGYFERVDPVTRTTTGEPQTFEMSRADYLAGAIGQLKIKK